MRALADFLNEDWRLLEKLAGESQVHYRFYSLPKPDGTRRQVHEPDGALKPIQKKILQRILRRVPRHSANHSGSGCSILTNARAHLGRPWVYTFDIRRAFPSARRRRVREGLTLALEDAGLPRTWAGPIVNLTMLKDSLPQGAPTSSALLDLVLRPVDSELLSLARRVRGNYTRYVDDLTISVRRRIPHPVHSVARILEVRGFRLNHDKTCQWPIGRPATVTGLILRRGVAVGDDIVLRIRGALEFLDQHPDEVGAEDRERLRGLIAFMCGIEPHRGACYRRRFQQLLRLAIPGVDSGVG